MKIFSKLLPASKKKLVIYGIGAMALVAFSVIVLYEATKKEVVLAANGEKQTIQTHADTVKELLDETGIEAEKYDKLSHDLDASIKNGMKIEYDAAKSIFVTVDGEKETYYTTVDTIGEFLDEKDLEVSRQDDISHERSDTIKDGLELSIDKAYQIAINDGGNEKKVWTTGGTIKQLLHTNDIELDEMDKIKPGLDEKVTRNTAVAIVRVEKTREAVEEKIDFETVTENDRSLEKGQKKVISEGEQGLIVKTYEIIKENGKEVDRELVDKEVKKKKTDRVVAVGTKAPKLVTLASNSDSSSSSGGKVLNMIATAFTASCAGCSGYTSTGINLKANPNKKVIAVDPNVIPLGSKVWVEGYGNAVAGDTGGFSGKKIDLHMPTKADAYRFGRKSVKVKIID